MHAMPYLLSPYNNVPTRIGELANFANIQQKTEVAPLSHQRQQSEKPIIS